MIIPQIHAVNRIGIPIIISERNAPRSPRVNCKKPVFVLPATIVPKPGVINKRIFITSAMTASGILLLFLFAPRADFLLAAFLLLFFISYLGNTGF